MSIQTLMSVLQGCVATSDWRLAPISANLRLRMVTLGGGRADAFVVAARVPVWPLAMLCGIEPPSRIQPKC